MPKEGLAGWGPFFGYDNDKDLKGSTINDLGGGPEKIEKKKISTTLLQGKKF